MYTTEKNIWKIYENLHDFTSSPNFKRHIYSFSLFFQLYSLLEKNYAGSIYSNSTSFQYKNPYKKINFTKYIISTPFPFSSPIHYNQQNTTLSAG